MSSWIYLNEEGKEKLGDVFPTGRVPVRSIISCMVNTPPGESFEAYIVDPADLSDDQLNTLSETVARNFGAPIDVVKSEIKEKGLPLRTVLTDGTGGTDDVHLFL